MPSASLHTKTMEASATGSQRIDGVQFDVYRFSRERMCPMCDLRFAEPEPRTFSFNSSLGACPRCEGLGEVSQLDRDKIVPDRSKSLREGAIAPWTTPAYRHELDELLALADEYDIPVDVPVRKLSQKAWRLIEHGVPARNFGGLDGFSPGWMLESTRCIFASSLPVGGRIKHMSRLPRKAIET